MTPAPAWLLEVIRPGVHGLARLLFGVRFVNPEHVPARGPVVLAPNHVTYLDPVLVSIPIHRPLHYMTLASFFDITGLGAVIRWARAFPVEEDEADLSPAAGRAARRTRDAELADLVRARIATAL